LYSNLNSCFFCRQFYFIHKILYIIYHDYIIFISNQIYWQGHNFFSDSHRLRHGINFFLKIRWMDINIFGRTKYPCTGPSPQVNNARSLKIKGNCNKIPIKSLVPPHYVCNGYLLVRLIQVTVYNS
jgi:hypothetical protein